MSHLSLPAKVSISEEVLFQHIDNEFVLLNMVSEKYFGLDEVAARFWTLFTEDSSIQNALEKVQSEFEADPETIKKDLMIFLDRLLEEKLIIIEKN